MKNRITLFSLLFCSAVNGFGQGPLWGKLEKGKYETGFTVLYRYDYSRPMLSDQLLDGKKGVSVPRAPGRQMQIGVWYPATGKVNPMLYRDYIDELGREIDFSPLTSDRKMRALDQVIDLYRDYQQNDTFSKDQMTSVLNSRVAATRQAKPAPGKFPILIFPHWHSPMDGSIMGEYLASQGFVVVTTSLKGSDTVLPEISPRGLKSIATDINFIINEVSDLPYADVEKIAVMGVGINATGALTALKDVSTIDAFISLDGGIITTFELPMFQQRGDVNLVSLAKPMLFIHAPHPSVIPQLADYFKFSDKHYIAYSQMSEYYFLNNGMIESMIPGIIGKAPGDVKSGFESAARNICNFLKYTLSGDQQAKSALEATETNDIIKSFKKGLPVPPDLADLKLICAERGAGGLLETYKTCSAVDKQPFTQFVLADLNSWLAFRRDEDFSIRLALMQIWMESYPRSSRGAFTWARILVAQNKKEEAKDFYRKALEFLEQDDDIYLDNVTRSRIKTVSTDALSGT